MGFKSWRGDAGMIAPTMRPGPSEEVIRLLPDGVGMLTLYLEIRRGERNEFEEALPAYEKLASKLASAGCEVIHPAGAPPFMLLNPEGERRRLQEWEDKYNAQFFTSGSNHLAAFAALGLKRIVGASYSGVQNRIVLDYMAKAGVELLAMEPIETPFEAVGDIASTALYAHVKRLFLASPGAQGVYIQGSGWRTLDVIEALEQDLRVPVVHAVAAKVWEFQKRLKIHAPKEGFGVLLRDLPDLTLLR